MAGTHNAGRGSRGAEGKELVQMSSPLLLCSPAQEYKVLRDVVRNPGLRVLIFGK